MRTKYLASRVARRLLAVGMVVTAVAAAFNSIPGAIATANESPTLTSDQADYAPGATVTLHGDNWQPAESVRIIVNDTIGQTWQRDVTVTAASDGTITDSFALPNYFVATYDATASGPVSGTVTTTFTDNDTYDWAQCKNDNGGGGGTVNDNVMDQCNWVNGNLGATNSIYTEGDVVPQRLLRTVATAGAHSVTLDHSFLDGSDYTYDFFATPDSTLKGLLAACDDVPTSGNFGTFTSAGCDTLLAGRSELSIPDEATYPTGANTYTYPHLADAEANGAADGVTRNLWISCGHISGGVLVADGCTGVSLDVLGHGDSNKNLLAAADQTSKTDSFTQMQISFTTSFADSFVAVWVGGHLAKTSFWDGLSDSYAGQGAHYASGSSFHERIIADETGAVGNRDNQLQVGVVVAPGSITVVKDDLTDSSTPFSFTAGAPLSPSSFTLCDPAVTGCLSSQTFAALPTGTYTVDEVGQPGWDLSKLNCVGGTSTFDYSATGATVHAQPGDNVTCTFTNSQIKNEATGSLKIAKTLDTGGSGFDTTTKFTIQYACDSGGPTGSVMLTGGTDQTIGGIPVGSVCTVSEPTQPAAPSGYSWTVTVTPNPAPAITLDAITTVTVANVLTHDKGSLKITKTLSNPDGAAFPSGYTFTINYDCGPQYASSVSVAAGASTTVNNLPTGASCTVSEPTPATILGYSWGTPVISGSPAVIGKDTTVEVTVANTITRDYGSISGMKWNDWDHDGVHDTVPAEPPLQGWQIRIFNGDNSVNLQTTTDAQGNYTFAVPTGTYTVCEKLLANWVQSYPTTNAVCGADGKGYTVTIVKNQTIIGKDFGNWQQPFCTKAAPTAALDPATGIYPGNKGPDYVVRVDLGQSVQAAVDAAAVTNDPTKGDVNKDGYLIVAVSAKADRTYGGDATQAVAISAAYTKPFALIGCSVTLHDPNRSDGKPTIRIMSSANGTPTPIADAVGGKASIVLMDLHGADSEVAGVLAEGTGRYIWNSYSLKSAVGLKIVGDGNTVHNGQGTSNTGAGVVINGKGNFVTDTSAMSNGGNGFDVTGSSNQLVKLNAGDKATPNKGDGVHVVGDSNSLSEITAYANAYDGIDVAGATNTLSLNVAGDGGKGNGQSGFRVAGAGNLLQTNTARANTGDGFTITLGTAASPNRLKANESNTGTSGSTLENKGAEYRLTGSVKNDSGGNKADSIVVPKTTSPTKCTGFPGTNATVTFGSANACE